MTEIIRKCDQSCQTMPFCDKSTETILNYKIISNKIIPSKIISSEIISKNFIENRMMRDYYRKRNLKTDILNLKIENESQRERAKKEIINEFNKNNNEVPKWLLGIKQ